MDVYDVSIFRLSRAIGVNYMALYNKFEGERDFKLSEVLLITTYIRRISGRKYSIEYLFRVREDFISNGD